MHLNRTTEERKAFISLRYTLTNHLLKLTEDYTSQLDVTRKEVKATYYAVEQLHHGEDISLQNETHCVELKLALLAQAPQGTWPSFLTDLSKEQRLQAAGLLSIELSKEKHCNEKDQYVNKVKGQLVEIAIIGSFFKGASKVLRGTLASLKMSLSKQAEHSQGIVKECLSGEVLQQFLWNV